MASRDKSNEPMFDPAKLNIIPVDLDNEMKKSYIDYSMSVIVRTKAGSQKNTLCNV